MRKFTKMFNNYKVVVLPFPSALRLYFLKYNKTDQLRIGDYNDAYVYMVYDMFELSKKLVYDVDKGITPEDIYNLLISTGFDFLELPETQDLMSAIDHSCKEILAWLVSYDLYNSNIYIHELSEDKIVLEVEEHLA